MEQNIDEEKPSMSFQVYLSVNDYFTRNEFREQFYQFLMEAIEERFEIDTAKLKEESQHEFTMATAIKEMGLIEIMENTLVADIARFEAYTVDILKLYLKDYPYLILTEPKGIPSIEKTDIQNFAVDFLKTNDIDKNVNLLISARLDTLRSSQSFFTYFMFVTGVKIPDDLLEHYYEMKATRNVIIHSKGFIDQKYMGAAKKNHRGKPNERIKVDAKYLDKSTVILHELVNVMHEDLKFIT